MQALFSFAAYGDSMSKATAIDLKKLREAAGLSQRGLARLINEQQSNVRYWETSGNLPRSNVLVPMAKALGVTVEELLGEARPKRVVSPGGRASQLFSAVAKLPRRQQEKILDILEPFVREHVTANS